MKLTYPFACLVACCGLFLSACDGSGTPSASSGSATSSATAEVSTAASQVTGTRTPTPGASPSPSATSTPPPAPTSTSSPTATPVATATPPPPPPAPLTLPDGQQFSLSVGRSVQMSNGDTLRFVGVLDDSRCPPDVQCIWAGRATVAFMVGGAELRVVLEPGQGEGTANGTLVRVLGLTPASGAAQNASAVVTLVVERARTAASGVYGTVTIGPMCPVQREDQPCPDRPFEATLVVRNMTGVEVARTASDATGAYSVALAAGRYRVTPLTAGGAPLPRASEFEVSVTQGTWTRVDVAYDSGIR